MNMRSNDGNFEKYKSEMLRMYQQQNRPINSASGQKNNFSSGSNQGEYVSNSNNRNDDVLTNLNAKLSNMASSSDPNERNSKNALRLDDDFPPASYRQDVSSHTVRGDTPIEYDSHGRRTSDLIFEIADQNFRNVNESGNRPQSAGNLSNLTENSAYPMQNLGQQQQNNLNPRNVNYEANQGYDWQQFSNNLAEKNRDSSQNVANLENMQINNENTSGGEQSNQDLRNFESRNTSNGFLKVQVYSARGAFPVKDAKITISKEIDGQNKIFYEIVTDESGITQPVSLPAPDASHSFAIDGIRPYENYSILVSKLGFEDAVRNGLPIFPGVVSLQPIQLRPLLGSEQETDPNLERNS